MLNRPSSAAANAVRPAADHARIGAAVARLRDVFGRRPEAARDPDAPATAALGAGLRCDVGGPDGQRACTGMPTAAGGDGDAPTPGWLMRAGMAACTATVIGIYAAERGIVLELLEVTVHSVSDVRGLLGMDDVSAAMLELRTEVRIGAAGVPEDTLRALVLDAQRRSPTAATVAAGDAGTVTIDVIA